MDPKKALPRIAKQTSRWGQEKEIIDLEETVCLPRYTCGKKRISDDFGVPFTDILNHQTVSFFQVKGLEQNMD